MLFSISILSSCTKMTTYELSIINDTGDTLYSDFIKQGQYYKYINEVVMTPDNRTGSFTIYNFPGEMNDISTDLLMSHVDNVRIYKIINGDSLFLPVSKYNKDSDWKLYSGNDMGYQTISFVLTVTSEMFDE